MSALSIRQVAIRTLLGIRRVSHLAQLEPDSSGLFKHVRSEDIRPKRKIQLRGYPYVPGGDDPTMPEYLSGPRDNFPYALECQPRPNYTFKDWGLAYKEKLDELLPKYGAVLFRNSAITGPADLFDMRELFGFTPMDYQYGSGARDAEYKNIYFSNDDPPQYIIELHTELAYTHKVCRKLMFYCHREANYGGETPICKVNEYVPNLDKTLLKNLEERKVRYIRNIPDANHEDGGHLNWQKRLQAKTRDEAEEGLAKLGINWEWRDDGYLTYWYNRPAFMTHPENGEKLWFNQIIAHHDTYYRASPAYGPDLEKHKYPSHSCYGDGQEIEPEYMQNMRNVGWEKAVAVPWKKGDFMVLENLYNQHGRCNFSGNRGMYVAFTAD